MSYILQMIDHEIVAASMGRLVCAFDFETWAASMCLCHLNGEQVFFANREGGWVGGWVASLITERGVVSVFIGM